MADQLTQVPFYLDWKFWLAAGSLAASTVAVILSQLPPLRLLFSRGRLDLEVYRVMALRHSVGNPDVQVHLIISNGGGKRGKIKDIKLHFQRNTADHFILPAQGYFQAVSDTDPVLLTPFRLEPNQEWGHIVSFFSRRAHQEEKEVRQLQANLVQDILNKRIGLEKDAPDVAAEEETVRPIIEFFRNKFRWKHGEYEVTVQVEAEPATASVKKEYRITLFESDSKGLEDYSLDYAYGYGVYLPVRRPAVLVPLREA